MLRDDPTYWHSETPAERLPTRWIIAPVITMPLLPTCEAFESAFVFS
jgi:hypothetical protein